MLYPYQYIFAYQGLIKNVFKQTPEHTVTHIYLAISLQEASVLYIFLFSEQYTM